MTDLLRIFTPIVEDSGVGFYRLHQPTKWMSDNEKAYLMTSPYTGARQIDGISQKLVEQASQWADIIFTNTAKDQKSLALLMAMRDWKQKKLIVDVDDNLVNLNQDHPSYAVYQDKQLDVSGWAQRSMMYADLVVTTNEFLKELYWPLNHNIFISPNSMDLNEISKYPKKKNKKITIGWAGAAGHTDNLKLILEPLKAILKKYDVEFMSFGDKIQELPGKNQPFVSMSEYYKTYAKCGFDIAIAPLNDTRYNRGKSNLRLIEAGAFKIPVVASPNGPYKKFPCLYAQTQEEWYKSLEALVLSENLRKRYADKAYQEVKNKYNVEVNSPKLLEAFERVIRSPWKDKQKVEHSEPMSRKI